MAKVKLLGQTRYNGKSLNRGDIEEVSNLVAERWKRGRIATPLEQIIVETEETAPIRTVEVPVKETEEVQTTIPAATKESEEAQKPADGCEVSMDNTKAGLIEYAVNKGVDGVHDRMTKAEILDLIKNPAK